MRGEPRNAPRTPHPSGLTPEDQLKPGQVSDLIDYGKGKGLALVKLEEHEPGAIPELDNKVQIRITRELSFYARQRLRIRRRRGLFDAAHILGRDGKPVPPSDFYGDDPSLQNGNASGAAAGSSLR